MSKSALEINPYLELPATAADVAATVIAAEQAGILPDVNQTLKEQNASVALQDPDKDWHLKKHAWAIVTDRLIEAEILPKIIRVNTQAKIIGRMLVHDERYSTVLRDTRAPEEKPNDYYRARLKSHAAKHAKAIH